MASRPIFAPWKQLFANPLYPNHALAGLDFNTVWNETYKNKSGQNIGNGPFILQSYVKGYEQSPYTYRAWGLRHAWPVRDQPT